MGFAYLLKLLFDMCRHTGDAREAAHNSVALEEYLNPDNHFVKKYNFTQYRDSTTEKGHPVLPTCCICMEDFKEEENEEVIMICHCFHAFHTPCLTECRGRPVCPVCNYDLRTGRPEEISLANETQSISQNPDEQTHSSGETVLLLNEDTEKTIQNILSNPYSTPLLPSDQTNIVI